MSSPMLLFLGDCAVVHAVSELERGGYVLIVAGTLALVVLFRTVICTTIRR